MAKFVIDSSAWIEYLSGSKKGAKIQKYFEDNELITTGVCVAEVVAKVLREGLSVEIALDAMRSQSGVMPVDFSIGKDGGNLYFILRKSKPKISLSDVLTIAAARKFGAKILTFDNDFSGIPEAIIF